MNSVSGKVNTGSRAASASAAYAAVCKILSGYDTGFELIRTISPEAIERFVVLSVRGTPRLLLPKDPLAMRTAIQSFLGNRPFAGLLPAFVQFASRTGGPFSSVCNDLSLISADSAVSPLRHLMSDVLDRQDFHLAMRLSFGRPNAKTVAMAISAEGHVLCYAKFGSEAMTNDLVAHESAVLAELESQDMPFIMPTRLYSGKWAGNHNVLITSPMDYRGLDRDASQAHRVAADFSSRNLSGMTALKSSNFWQQVRSRADQMSTNDDSDGILLQRVALIEEHWGEHPFEFGPSHGDWSRANLGMIGDQVAAWDWERYSREAPRGIDIAHFTISEVTHPFFGKPLDVDNLQTRLKQYLDVAELPPTDAAPLLMLAMLEMAMRFKSAQKAGLKLVDSKFGPAIDDGLKKWA